MKITILPFVLALAVVVSCSRGGKKGPEGGGVDGGGGDFIFNTREEVISGLEYAWEMLTSEGGSPNPIYQARSSLASDSPSKERAHLAKIFQRMVTFRCKSIQPTSGGGAVLSDDETDCQGGGLMEEYLRTKKPQLNESSLCSGPGHRSHIAAVSKLDRSGVICLSIYGLMRSSSALIKFDLLALLIHEIAHLNGFGEADALLVQKYVLKNIERIGRIDGFRTKKLAAQNFWYSAFRYWPALITYAELNESYVVKIQRLGERIGDARRFYFPEVHNVHDDLQIKRPELRNDIYLRIEDLLKDLQGYGERIEAEIKTGNSVQMDSMRLQEVRKIAMRMLEIRADHQLYLFGDEPVRLEFLAGDPLIGREAELVGWATNPITLTSVGRRPVLSCARIRESSWFMKDREPFVLESRCGNHCTEEDPNCEEEGKRSRQGHEVIELHRPPRRRSHL